MFAVVDGIFCPTPNLAGGDVHDIICSKLVKLIYEREIEETEGVNEKKTQLSLFDFVKNDSNN